MILVFSESTLRSEIMDKKAIIEKLERMGISTVNAYPKSSFLHEGDVHVGLYEREMKDDFYFFNKYDSKLYVWKKNTSDEPDTYAYDSVTEKFMIPMSDCELVWEDKPFVEKPDKPYKEMTLREYACIQLRVPDSGLPWLDTLIKETSPL